MKLVAYDDELITEAAWRLAVAAGYRYGRGPVEEYERQVVAVIVSLEVALEERAREDTQIERVP